MSLFSVLFPTPARSQSPGPQPTSAQDAPQDKTKGAIAGTVLDSSAAAMPGVQVIITNTTGADTAATNTAGVPQTAVADEKGEFRLTDLPPGNYTVSVTLQGFKDFRQDSVVVTAGQTTRVNITLQAATVTEKVNVEGNVATTVEQQSSQISGTVTSKELTSLMLNGRNFTQLIALTPGVSNQTGQDEALVGVKGSVKYSVNGGRVEYNSYEVDGGDILNASLNGSSSTLIVYPSVDAIGSLQVLTSNYGAMWGRSASGITTASTKSGADFSGFHGGGYLFVRNEHLNARNFFDQTRRAPLYQKYDPGFTLGGPLFIPGLFNTKKNKTFFFFSEEYRHEREPVTFNQAVPSAAERQGNFTDVCPTSAIGTQPAGTIGGILGGFGFVRSVGAAKITGSPYFPDCPGVFTGTTSHGYDILAAAPILPISVPAQAQAIISSGLIPLPNSDSGCNSTASSTTFDPNTLLPLDNPHCYNASISPLTTWRQELFRIDHNFTPNHKLYFRYIHDDWSTVVTVPQWAVNYNSFPTVENNFVGPGLSMVAHLNSTFGTKLVNDLAMAYSTDHISLTNLAGPGVTSLSRSSYPTFAQAPCSPGFSCTPGGIGYLFGQPATDVNGVPFGDKLPGIVFSGTNFAYGGHGFSADTGYMPWHHSNPTYTPRDDATLALGKHTLEFGVLAILAQRNEVNPPVGGNTGNVQGTLFFSNVNQQTNGNAFYDFLSFGDPVIGEPKTYTQDSAQGVYHNNYTVIEPYLQDDWKVTRRLTLNLGLRISLFGLYQEKNLTSFNFVPSQFNSALASQLTYERISGALINGPDLLPLPSNFVSVNPNNLSPFLTNGLVQCGVSKYADGTPVPAGCMTGHLFNPAPRLGFAWDPFGTGKTSIRGGYGIFFEHGTGNEANTGSLEGSPGNLNQGGVLSMTEYGVHGWACVGDVGTGCKQNLGSAFPINVTSIPTKVNWPYTQQWSFSIQRELPAKMLASVAYVGSKGTHLTAELNANQLVPVNKSQNPFLPGQPIDTNFCEVVAQADTSAVTGSVASTTWNGNPFNSQSPGFVNALAACYGSPLNPSLQTNLPTYLPGQLRTPGNVVAPFVGQVYSLQNVANSVYHALQVSLRRTAAPLTLGVSYTYSHSIDDSSDRTEATFINAYNLSSNRASSDFDQRHLLTFSYVYQLPLRIFHNMLNFADDDPTNQVANHNPSESRTHKIWDDWELSGITVFQSGTPFSVLNGGQADGLSPADNAGVVTVSGPASYPDLASSPSSLPLGFSSTPNTFGPLLGNPGRFVVPTGLTFGNAGRNSMSNPSRLNFDAALSKRFSIGEARSFEFRLETFNLFNHTQFRISDPSNPGNTGSNVITCYGGSSNSAGDPGCLASSSFLHPVDAHRPRTMQLGFKFNF